MAAPHDRQRIRVETFLVGLQAKFSRFMSFAEDHGLLELRSCNQGKSSEDESRGASVLFALKTFLSRHLLISA